MWDVRHQALLWVDQFAGLVHLARQNEADELALATTYHTGVTVGAVVPLVSADGGWMLAAGSGFCHLSDVGVVTPVGESLIDPKQLRMNDGKCDPQGRFWAGSMAWAKTPAAASLYCLATDGRTTVARTKLTISNGSAWTPDGRTMYFIDTPTQRIDRFDVTADGELRDQQTVVQIESELGAPDGMCIDDDGCLWVALWGGNAVHRYSAQGELLAVVTVDAPQVSSCAFGGADCRTLFITTSQEGYDQAASECHPLAGRVFRVELDTTGPDVAPFRGAPPARAV
ncbi:SMP-30/gluconolactonase/LRE family protein [Parafrigoribacterium mesophilum]|uniref:SMP-30/gluconolactonase/LRE family protein n=1 Tax=Parafrigoribacterium mesophilum TaxID=433646 RepID=UPI0031FD484F